MKKVLFLAAAVATLFASCSKDATEDVATVQTGDVAFYASMSFEADATTRHHINNDGVYEWEAGDMVGVHKDGTTIPFVTVQGGVDAAFQAVESDLDYLGAAPYFMVYPYSNDNQVNASVDATTGAITVSGLEVPYTQRYRPNSFSTMTAPAFAYVEEFENNSQVEFQAAASMIEVPFVGKGAIKKLTMFSDSQYTLSGSIEAVLSENEAGEAVVEYNTVNGSNTVEIDFGKSALELNYYLTDETPKVVFVVAPGELPNGDTFYIVADFVDENMGSAWATLEIPENTTLEPNKLYSVKEPKVLGLGNFQLVDGEDAELDFIVSAYNGGSELLLISDLDFEAFDAAAAYAEIGAISNKTPEQENKYAALQWYIGNENAITSLSNGVIAGGNAEPTVISGLNVIGNGFTTGATLENIKIENSNVKVVNAAIAGFVAPSTDGISVNDVVIGENNNLVIATEETATFYAGGIAGAYVVKGVDFDVEVEALPAIVNVLGSANVVAGQVYGSFATNADVKVNLDDYAVASLDAPAFALVAGSKVIDFTTSVAGANSTNVIATNKNSASSIIVNGVSYWNGTAVENIGGDAYYTAEELAYDLGNSAAFEAVLTHDIDMMCSDELVVNVLNGNTAKATSVSSAIVDEAQMQYEIKNIITNAQSGKVVSLFGNVANVSNVKLTNVVINAAANGPEAISGVAISGSAKNVVVEGMAINIAKGVALVNNSIGGVFSTVDADDVDTVDVKSVAINYAGEEALAARAGIVAGTLNVTTSSKGVTLKPFAISGAKKAYTITKLGGAQKADAEIDGFAATKNYSERYAFGTVSVNNAAFAATHQEAVLNVANVDFCSWTGAFAAGIVFNSELTTAAAKKVDHDAAKVDSYDYSFLTNAPIGGSNGHKVWNFDKK